MNQLFFSFFFIPGILSAQVSDDLVIVSIQQTIQRRSLEAKVIVVELEEDAEFLVEVPAATYLKSITSGEILVGGADGEIEPRATFEGPLGRAV